MKNTQKLRFFENSFEKTHEADFFEKFFDENVAEDHAQFLAKTWCPYLFWVSRKLPHKFENLTHVTKSAKKTSPYGHLAKLEPQKQNN